MPSLQHNKTRATRNSLLAAFWTAFVLVAVTTFAGTQDSAAPNAQQSSSGAPVSSSKAGKHRHTPFDDFLIRGTVFNDKARALPGAGIRIRRIGEKKFRWQDVTNSRGDFAVRVPYDASYEVVTHAKGFLDQSKTVEAKQGSDQNLSFQMQPAQGKK